MVNDIDYKIVIPTKGRSHLIMKKTIGFLIKNKIDISKIDIWIGSKEEVLEAGAKNGPRTARAAF